MKKVVLVLIINFLLLGIGMAQIPEEAFPLTNSLSKLWRNGDTDKAIKASLELYRLYPPFLLDRIHNTLAQQLPKDSQRFGLKYLEQLQKEGNQDINEIIAPIYLWSKAINAHEKQEIISIKEELKQLQKDRSDYKSQRERYCLLIFKELDKNNAIDNEQRIELVNRTISSLAANLTNLGNATTSKEREERAWHRYLLAYSYDYLYTIGKGSEEYLKKASDFSPDLNDRLNKSAYFYDAALLTGNPEQIGYKLKYLKYLNNNNRKGEALDLLCNITFSNPSDDNLKLLEDYYGNTKNAISFKRFWENYIHNQGKPVPKVKIKFENEELDLTHKSGSWVYIDVWGTWCSPCLEELPDLQSLYSSIKQVQHSKLKIYTFSFGSKNLSDFMAKNKYTFLVSEIDKQTNDLFEVSGYPTKILISPQGNFIKIPFGEDWKTYIKNYTLL